MIDSYICIYLYIRLLNNLIIIYVHVFLLFKTTLPVSIFTHSSLALSPPKPAWTESAYVPLKLGWNHVHYRETPAGIPTAPLR